MESAGGGGLVTLRPIPAWPVTNVGTKGQPAPSALTEVVYQSAQAV